jgi:hypothetical protein
MRLREETKALEQIISQSAAYRAGGVGTEEFKQAMQYFIKNKNETIKMSNDKKFLAHKEEIFRKAGEASTQQSLLMKIIEQALKEFDVLIWRTDKSGEIIRDSEGNPKVDWIKVIFNIGKIVGTVFAIKDAYDKENK